MVIKKISLWVWLIVAFNLLWGLTCRLYARAADPAYSGRHFRVETDYKA